ncbi:HNH endonuclease [Thioalkalivibrio sp. ALJ7]|uniref:HNH endonuclease n=1 Tax=Thioalkalivibrio sp. ALJ7 TaxID=1158756 RepID=UPI0003606936|nr:HNH endonuclease [Thioalkalivibrio sp. ALJ7]
MEDALERDARIRNAAFQHLKTLLVTDQVVDHYALAQGFPFEGAVIRFLSQAEGIFKPKEMRWPLSVKTVVPKKGRDVWYRDQLSAHQEVLTSSETVRYAFKGEDPNAKPNQGLREVMELQLPITYFLGVAPARYQPIFPAYVVDWDSYHKEVRIAFLPEDQGTPGVRDIEVERRYGLQEVQVRLHQTRFREAVLGAYKGKCALTGLPVPRLLDAAHIVPDKDQVHGQPEVENGLALTKLHHAAFDAYLIGIDQDLRVHISSVLKMKNDGPALEALKQLEGARLTQPDDARDAPDRDRLKYRFECFLERA